MTLGSHRWNWFQLGTRNSFSVCYQIELQSLWYGDLCIVLSKQYELKQPQCNKRALHNLQPRILTAVKRGNCKFWQSLLRPQKKIKISEFTKKWISTSPQTSNYVLMFYNFQKYKAPLTVRYSGDSLASTVLSVLSQNFWVRKASAESLVKTVTILKIKWLHRW